MSDRAGLDVRIPVGGLFAAVGALLTGYGLATAGDRALYDRSLHIDINLWWGLVMLAFGLILLWAGVRSGRAAARPTEDSPAGRAMEAREHAEGLEENGATGDDA